MKKIISLLLIISTAIFCLVSCSDKKPAPPESAGSILSAFEGEYSEENHIKAIDRYITTRNPKRIEKGTSIVIPAESDIKGAYIHTVAEGADKGETELMLKIDLEIDYKINKESKSVTIDTDWWYDTSDYLLNDGLWSFLVSVTLESGKTVWYYLRVEFVPIDKQ